MIFFIIITIVFVPCSIEDDDNPSFLIAIGDIDLRYSLIGKSKENYTRVEEASNKEKRFPYNVHDISTFFKVNSHYHL